MEYSEFANLKKRINHRFIENGWVTVFDNTKKEELIYSAILSRDVTTEALTRVTWEMTCDNNRPYAYNGEYHTINDGDFEPIVLMRGPWGAVGKYIELTEDFRCYHNLFEKTDKAEKKYYYLDRNGDEELVAKVSNIKVEIKHKFLLDYISAKGKNLFIYFDYRSLSQNLTDASEFHNDLIKGTDFIYEEIVKDVTKEIPHYISSYLMMGKVMIKMIENYVHDEIWGNIEEHDRYEKFVFKYDNEGKEVECSCCPDTLTEKGYLTPVYFKKEVLDKYYQNPSKYSIDDGMVCCNGVWSLYIDNNIADYVVVLLGDLGKNLSYKEQHYWRSFNCIPDVIKLSKTAFDRWFNGKFCDPESPDLLLKSTYEQFCENWKSKFGWDLFLPMTSEDEYNFTSIHLISDPNNIKDFDYQILALTKTFIDSLNEQQLGKGLNLNKDSKGIDKLDAFLSHRNKSNQDLIIFIRNLQSLRSQTVAHRKSRDGNKKSKDYFKFDEKNYGMILQDIMNKLIDMLNFLMTIEK